jgi:hypothetical protein
VTTIQLPDLWDFGSDGIHRWFCRSFEDSIEWSRFRSSSNSDF